MYPESLLAASLVRSLFCGLPRQDKRMAVFISASDENSGSDGCGRFLFAGWIGPERDWSDFFVPAWQERVLDGPPQIPYLHMTEIRSNEFREIWKISTREADDRVKAAISVLDTMGSFYPLVVELDGGHVKEIFAESKVSRLNAKQFEAKPFEPDYLCFLAYAYGILGYVHDVHPSVEKVDFIVEQKGYITRYINEFHANLGSALAAIDCEYLSPLVGALSVGDKERIPCQAADVLCWHIARFNKWVDDGQHQDLPYADIVDLRRYWKLRNRHGKLITLDNKVLSEMAAAILSHEIDKGEAAHG